MSNLNLEKTKQKLTIIFTLLVFALAILLEGVFFSIKYYNYKSTDIKLFNAFILNVYHSDYGLNELIKKLDKRGNFGEGMFHGTGLQKMGEGAQVNILIIDRQENELVFSKIINDLDIDIIKNLLTRGDYGNIYTNSKYIVEKFAIVDNNRNYDILFIKQFKYSFLDYLIDLLGFVFITLIFSVLFYYIGSKFVGKNLEPVKNTLNDMQSFIHNAGHELKTPISIIHSNLQLIKATKSFDKELIEEGLIEINKLDGLIESLVELSNINSSEYNEKIDVANEIKSIIKDFKQMAEQKKVKIKFSNKGNKELFINKHYFYILFSNILKNAIRYNKKCGSIDIVLDFNKIVIKDTGIGIKKKDLKKIFDRFFMSTTSRNSEGYGIGLSLVKKIADIYNMKIIVESDIGKGTIFIIKF